MCVKPNAGSLLVCLVLENPGYRHTRRVGDPGIFYPGTSHYGHLDPRCVLLLIFKKEREQIQSHCKLQLTRSGACVYLARSTGASSRFLSGSPSGIHRSPIGVTTGVYIGTAISSSPAPSVLFEHPEPSRGGAPCVTYELGQAPASHCTRTGVYEQDTARHGAYTAHIVGTIQ